MLLWKINLKNKDMAGINFIEDEQYKPKLKFRKNNNIDEIKEQEDYEKNEAKRILELFDNNKYFARQCTHELIRQLTDYKKSNLYINVLNYLD